VFLKFENEEGDRLMRKFGSVLVLVAATASLGVAGSASAQQGQVVETFTCESQDDRHHECRYNSSGMVTVHVRNQLSKTRCVFNENWGTFDGGVWVDYGCRAEFEVRRPPQESTYRPVGGTLKTVTCESSDRSYKLCPVSGIDASSVQVERQHSSTPCTRGVNWGVSEGENSPPGIWVDQGCRATFAYHARGESYQPYGGTPHDFELPCESLRGQWNHCEVPQIHLARVELIAGNNECNVYKAWGTDDTGIWVHDNCQGAFRITYRH
jgi:hypothetical protein